jgi:hypothetical protein
MLLLISAPLTAQDLPSSVTLGGSLSEGAAARKVSVTLKMLGAETAVPDFKLLVMAKYAAKPHENATCITDGQGRVTVTMNTPPEELRVFAYGDYVIPDGWANIPVSTMKFADTESWELRVRPLKNVRVSGKVTVDGIDAPPKRANVSFAPLDVAQDGSSRMFDQPYSTLADDEGNYVMELPTGYYQVWSYWTDRSGKDWVGFIRVENNVPVFKETALNLSLRKGPWLKGKVIDARTGKGIAASIDLYSNLYLRQLRNPTADGEFPDAYDDKDQPIFWPVGTFNFQAWMVNPDDFTVVIKPQGTEAITRVIANQNAADFDGQEIEWKLFTEDMRQVDVRVATHEQDIPVMALDVKLMPKKVDVPEHIHQSYSAGAITDADGRARFLGLASGTYEAFGASGSTFLGEVTVGKEAKQEQTMKWEIPFAYGTVKLPNGEVCRNLVVILTQTLPNGREFGPYRFDAFRDNPKLQEAGRVFVPLLSFGATFKLRFAAMADGGAITSRDWTGINDFPLVTDETEIKVDAEKGWKIEQTLKPNPDYKKGD